MKVLLTAWLIYNGSVVPESITQRTFNTMNECLQKGSEVSRYFDGRKTLHTAAYICTEKGVDL